MKTPIVRSSCIKDPMTKIKEKTEKSILLEFSVPASSPYFDGHFPGFPILPAVAQVDLVVKYAEKYLGIKSGISKINRTKFTNLIRPEVPLVLFMEINKGRITFKISSGDGGIIYSFGTMIIREK